RLPRARLPPRPHPFLALGAGSVGEAFGYDSAAARALERVVADLGGRVHGLFDVALLQYLAGILGVMGPDTGEAVGLQFHFDAHGVVLALAGLAAQALHLAGDAQLVLHVVAHLVGNDVGVGNVAGGAQPLLQGVVEVQVDVDLLVGRAIERAHGGLAGAASGG